VCGSGTDRTSTRNTAATYDKDGNLLSKRDASGDVWSYSWDYRNRLTEVKETNAQNQVVLDEVFTYDVNNNLIGEAVNGVPQRWTVYDGSTPYLDLNAAGQVSERYLADPNALAQYWARVGQTGQADWMVTDLLGSVRELVSAGGSVEDRIAYDAYGNVVSETNPSAGGRLKYAGGQYDGGLGLTLFGARWYNSAAGRWLSQDPLGLGPDSNPYRYVGNGPTDEADPSGLAYYPITSRDFEALARRLGVTRGLTGGTAPYNNAIGAAFERITGLSLGAERNIQLYNTRNIRSHHRGVIPDFVADMPGLMMPPGLPRWLRSSVFTDAKARRGTITLATEDHQIEGYIWWLGNRSQAARTRGVYPVLHLVVFADTEIDPTVVQYAQIEGVILIRSYMEYDRGSGRLRVGAPRVLNPNLLRSMMQQRSIPMFGPPAAGVDECRMLP
jgi:RHS repeat-associated protein